MTLARVVTISVLVLAGSILAAACSFDVSASLPGSVTPNLRGLSKPFLRRFP